MKTDVPRQPVALLILLLGVGTGGVAEAQQLTSIYNEGDWVSLMDFRYVNCVDIDHRVVYAATTGGIERYNFVERLWNTPLTTSDGLPHRDVLVVAYDSSRGELWCGTRSGIAIYHTDLDSWRLIKSLQGLRDDVVEEIIIGGGDFGEYVYVKAGGSWYRIRKGTDFPERISAGDLPEGEDSKRKAPRDITPAEIERYPFIEAKTELDENLQQYELTSVAEDNWGTLWAGTWGGNLLSIKLITRAWERHHFGLVSRSVTALAKDGDRVWFAGGHTLRSGGISMMSANLQSWKHYEQEFVYELSGAVINDIVAGDGNTWVATTTGLVQHADDGDDWNRFRRGDGLPDDHVLCLELTDSVLWLGTRSGAARVEVDSLSFARLTGIEPVAEVNCIESGGDLIWVGTDQGVSVFEPDSLVALRGDRGGVPVPGGVNDLVYADGQLFIASDRGLYRYDVSERLLVSDPFPGAATGVRLHAIDVDGDNLWVGTDAGVERYDRTGGRWISYRPGSFELLAAPVTDALLDGDHVWFASPDGATRFFWDEPTRAR